MSDTQCPVWHDEEARCGLRVGHDGPHKSHGPRLTRQYVEWGGGLLGDKWTMPGNPELCAVVGAARPAACELPAGHDGHHTWSEPSGGERAPRGVAVGGRPRDNVLGPPELWRRVGFMLAASEPPTLELGRTYRGEVSARIVAASTGRGRRRDSFLVVAPSLAVLFEGLAAAAREWVEE